MRCPPNGPRIEYIHHASNWDRFAHLIALLLLAGLVTLVVVLVLRLINRTVPAAAGVAAPAPHATTAPATDDAALAQLRLRYANGDVDRDDYLRIAADLGAAVPTPDEPPAT
ncbi:MAG TPA: hypothetical protein VFB78_01410 [Acidimicrobiales bacterium]|nr:hypothetical protein [Acidimicrobiales bacterium]